MKSRILITFCVGSLCASGEVMYQLSEGASACPEVTIPKWTRSRLADDPFQVTSHACGYDLRISGNTVLVGLSCGYVDQRRMIEKYAVNLAHPDAVHQVEETEWNAATVLDRGWGWNADLKEAAAALRLPKSGPKAGGGSLSQGGSRYAVYGWSGTVRDPPGPPSYANSVADRIVDLLFPWTAARYEGHYWTDIYDVTSARRLIQIRGKFHREPPIYFQEQGKWFEGRFYVMPLEPNMEIPLTFQRDGMRRLLICDVDAAAKSKGAAETDAPPPLYPRAVYQMRILRPDAPEARITGFRDEPAFFAGTKNVETVNITALLDVLVPGEYTLELNIAGIQAKTVAKLSAGGGQLTVSIPAARLSALGFGGPYRIYYARLTRQAWDGQVLEENRVEHEYAASRQLGHSVDLIDVTTRPYSLSELGRVEK